MTIDIICMLALGVGFWTGYSRGIIQVLFNTVAWVFGVTLAFKMTPATTSMIETMSKSQNPLMFLAGFLVNIAIIMIVIRYAAKGMESLFEAAYMGTINQVLGGAVYAGFSILLFSVLLWFADKAMMIDDETKRLSKTYGYLIELPGQAKNMAIRAQPIFSEIWNTSVAWMDKLQSHSPQVKESKPKIYDIKDDATNSGIEGAPEDLQAKPKKKYSSSSSGDDAGIEYDDK